MAPASTVKPLLQGRRILVAEDDYMIVEEIVDMLSNAGGETLGPVPCVSDALRLIAKESMIDGALLDVNLGNEAIWPVVDTLLARSIPLVLSTGYDASVIPKAYAHLPRCEKPTTVKEVARVLGEVLTKAVR